MSSKRSQSEGEFRLGQLTGANMLHFHSNASFNFAPQTLHLIVLQTYIISGHTLDQSVSTNTPILLQTTKMASLSPEEKVEFLLQVLATGEFTPDYDTLAKVMGINNKSNAQRRLKAVVEADKRFILQSLGSSTSIKPSGKAGDAKDTPDAGKKTASAKKGRKRNKPAGEINEDESPSKVSKKDRKVQSDGGDEANGDGNDDGVEQHNNGEEVV